MPSDDACYFHNIDDSSLVSRHHFVGHGGIDAILAMYDT